MKYTSNTLNEMQSLDKNEPGKWEKACQKPNNWSWGLIKFDYWLKKTAISPTIVINFGWWFLAYRLAS